MCVLRLNIVLEGVILIGIWNFTMFYVILQSKHIFYRRQCKTPLILRGR